MDVTIRFTAPSDPDTAALRIYESAAQLGPFVQIDRTAAIGAYPNFIDHYTTTQATDKNDWFAIAWEDSSGAVGDMSTPLKGGTLSLIATLIDRVLQRDKSLSGDVVRQEAEATVETLFAIDPYTADLTTLVASGKQYRTLNGLTYMVLARALMARMIQNIESESATLGLVSFKASSGKTGLADIDALIEMAERDLGIGGTVVIDMERICKVYGGKDPRVLEQLLGIDQEYAILPYRPMWIEK